MRRRLLLLSLLLLVTILGGSYYLLKRAIPGLTVAGILTLDPNKRPMPDGIRGDTRVLSDGSFNYNPLRKHPPNFLPERLAYDKQWRERYAPLLAKNPRNGPSVYVHTFQDLSYSGVGIHGTYGSRLLYMAALNQWTNANVIGAIQPKSLGFKLIDPANPTAHLRYTVEDAITDALADPASQGAEWLVTGFYDDNRLTRQYTFAVYAIARADPAPEKRLTLFEENWEGIKGNFPKIAAQQRDALRPAVQALIDAGIVKSRPSNAAPGIVLQDELTEVADMFDVNDSRMIMEGIDRSLQLAALFPVETLPLQAAGFGHYLLTRGMVDHQVEFTLAQSIALRQYALSQLALAIDSRPVMTTLNWLSAQLPFDQPSWRWAQSDDAGTDPNLSQPALDAYLQAAENHMQRDLAPQKNAIPDVLVLRFESGQRNIAPRYEALTEYLFERAGLWRDHDIFLQALYANCLNYHYHSDGGDWRDYYEAAAQVASQATMANEAATLFQALDEPGKQRLALSLAVVSTLNEGRWAQLAEADYYTIRRESLEGFSEWPAPGEPGNPFYAALAACTQAAQSVLANPDSYRAPSGYSEFEFSPAERVRFWTELDCASTAIQAQRMVAIPDNYQNSVQLVKLYTDIRPENRSARSTYSYVLLDGLKRPGAGAALIEQASIAYALRPNQQALFRIGQTHLTHGDPELGQVYLSAGHRFDPYCPQDYMNSAFAYRDTGYYEMAEARFRAYLNFPVGALYDKTVARLNLADALCQLGRANDPETRAIYEQAAKDFPGRRDHQIGLIQYYIVWAKDYEAARRKIATLKGNDLIWQSARLEQALENNEKCVEWLDKLSPESGESAQGYAWDAQMYMKAGRIDLAGQRIEMANNAGATSPDVMLATAEYAVRTQDWQKALDTGTRALERLGPSSETYVVMAKAHNGMGHTDDAIRMLESLMEPPPQPWKSGCVPYLIELYIQEGRVDKAREALDWLVESGGRRREMVSEACDAMRKADAEKADEVWSRIDAIMAGRTLQRYANATRTPVVTLPAPAAAE